MKKILLPSILLFLTSVAFAGNADLFKINEEELNEEFAELVELKNYVEENSFISLAEIIETSSFNLSAFNLGSFGTTSQDDFVFQWEGFLWGFLCCPIGFFVIAVNKNKEHDQKVSFWIGVAVSSVISMIYNVALYGGPTGPY